MRWSICAEVRTGDGVFAATVGMGQGKPDGVTGDGLVVVRAGAMVAGVVVDDGGRCGGNAGDAWVDTGVVVVADGAIVV